MYLKMSSGKWWPAFLDLTELMFLISCLCPAQRCVRWEPGHPGPHVRRLVMALPPQHGHVVALSRPRTASWRPAKVTSRRTRNCVMNRDQAVQVRKSINQSINRLTESR